KMNFPKLKFSKKSASVIVFLFFNITAFAQNITLDEAVKMATENSLSAKSKTLLSEYYKMRISTGANIPQTSLTAEFGQINAATTDNKFGVSQSFSFPTVYTNQKEVLKEEWNSSIIATKLNRVDVQKTVTELFYHILVLREREKILTQSD